MTAEAKLNHDLAMIADHDGGYTHTVTVDQLYVHHVDAELRARNNSPYWYLVTANFGAHNAFVTRAGLDRFLSERGLTLVNPIDNPGDGSFIVGSFRRACHITTPEEFGKIAGLHTYEMSNADWMLGIISTDPDGIRTVHVLNPNIYTRLVYDYRTISGLMK
jgi:hypothetical protein